MEQYLEIQIHQTLLFSLLLLAVIIFITLRAVYKLTRYALIRNNIDLKYLRFYPVLELIIWFGFIFWVLRKVFADTIFFTIFFVAIFIVGLLWFGWYAARDYIAGVILRAQDNYEVGQYLETDSVKGLIAKTGYFNFEIENEDGTRLKLPYGKIAGNIHLSKNEQAMIRSFSFPLQISSQKILDGALQKVYLTLLNCPWHVPYKKPLIKKMEDLADLTRFEIIVFTYGAESFEKLQVYVKKQLSEIIV